MRNCLFFLHCLKFQALFKDRFRCFDYAIIAAISSMIFSVFEFDIISTPRGVGLPCYLEIFVVSHRCRK